MPSSNWQLFYPSARLLFLICIIGYPVTMVVAIVILLITQLPLLLIITLIVMMIIEPMVYSFLLGPIYKDSRGMAVKSFKWVPPEQIQRVIEDILKDLKLKFERSDRVTLPGQFHFIHYVFNLSTVGLAIRVRLIVADTKEGKLWNIYIKDPEATGASISNQKADIANRLMARIDQNLMAITN